MRVRQFIFACFLCSNVCSGAVPKVLLVTMDGFGHRYLDTVPDTLISNFEYFIQNGVKAKWMENVFPSATYPNFYTMITGLYPESHGLVHNSFYDRALNDTFSIGNLADNFDPKWYTAETIYYTNQKAGPGRYSGAIAFPAGITPSKGKPLDHVIPNFFWGNITDLKYSHMEVDTMVQWFQDKDKPINLGLLYFAEPDEVCHKYGPDSNETRAMIGRLNDVIGYLKSELEDAGLLGSINIILTSDHGFVNHKGYVNIEGCSNSSWYYTNHNTGIVLFVFPKKVRWWGCGSDSIVWRQVCIRAVELKKIVLDVAELVFLLATFMIVKHIKGYEGRVYNDLKRCSSNVHVYRKGGPEMKAMHYGNNDRIAPIVLEAKIGYVITHSDQPERKRGGHHGYDPNKDHDLYPLFVASGPAFKTGYISEPIKSVDLYPLMCKLLEIEPAPNNGSMERVRQLLVGQSESDSVQSSVSLYVVLAAFVVTWFTW